MLRLLRRLGLFRERRTRGTRTPIAVDARLEIGVVALTGTACDVGAGGLFFATDAPLPLGVRGTLTRDDGGDPLVVRVSWRRDRGPGTQAGFGLAFDPGYIVIPSERQRADRKALRSLGTSLLP